MRRAIEIIGGIIFWGFVAVAISLVGYWAWTSLGWEILLLPVVSFCLLSVHIYISGCVNDD